MKFNIVMIVVISASQLLLASTAFAAAAQPDESKAAKPNAAASATTVAKKKGQPSIKPVDINSATKEELKKLPGIGDAEADKIIAGRPYLTKAHLQTHKIVSPNVYQGLRQLVVAKQKDSKFANDVKK